MKDTIKVPESLRCYLNKLTVRSAVQELLAKNPKAIDRSFRWDELRQYHEAWFSALRVRQDYTILLFDLMEEICLKPARERKLTEFFPLTNDYYDSDVLPSPYYIWEEGLYCTLKGLKGEDFVTFCIYVIDDAEGAKDGCLYLWLDTDIVEMDNLQPTTNWSFDVDDECWFIADAGSFKNEFIDVKRLRENVAQALDAILMKRSA